jgi:transposase-like protein
MTFLQNVEAASAPRTRWKRLNREIKRHTHVPGIFPTPASVLIDIH